MRNNSEWYKPVPKTCDSVMFECSFGRIMIIYYPFRGLFQEKCNILFTNINNRI